MLLTVFDDDFLIASDDHPHARFAVDVELAEQVAMSVVCGYEGSFESLGGADVDVAVGIREHDGAEMNCACQRQGVGRGQYRVGDVSAADLRRGHRRVCGIWLFPDGEDGEQDRGRDDRRGEPDEL